MYSIHANKEYNTHRHTHTTEELHFVQLLSFSHPIAVGLCGEPHTCAGAPQLPALRIALGADGGHRGGVGIGEGGAARAMLGLLNLLDAGPPLSGLSYLRVIAYYSY